MSDDNSDYQSLEQCDQELHEELIDMKKEVEYLRKSAQFQRTPLSASIDEMLRFMDDNIQSDPIASGFKNRSDNPFETKKCGKLRNLLAGKQNHQ